MTITMATRNAVVEAAGRKCRLTAHRVCLASLQRVYIGKITKNLCAYVFFKVHDMLVMDRVLDVCEVHQECGTADFISAYYLVITMHSNVSAME